MGPGHEAAAASPPDARRRPAALCHSSRTVLRVQHFYKMAAKFVVVVAFLAVANASIVRREAPPNPWEEIQKTAETFGKTFTEQWDKLVNSKNTAEASKAVKEHSDQMLKYLSQFSSTLQTAIVDASGKTKEVLETSRKNIEKTAEDLRKAHPEVEQQANKLGGQLQKAMQDGIKEVERLAKDIATNADEVNKKLAPQVKKAYQDLVKQAEEAQKKIHEAVTKQ